MLHVGHGPVLERDVGRCLLAEGGHAKRQTDDDQPRERSHYGTERSVWIRNVRPMEPTKCVALAPVTCPRLWMKCTPPFATTPQPARCQLPPRARRMVRSTTP